MNAAASDRLIGLEQRAERLAKGVAFSGGLTAITLVIVVVVAAKILKGQRTLFQNQVSLGNGCLYMSDRIDGLADKVYGSEPEPTS